MITVFTKALKVVVPLKRILSSVRGDVENRVKYSRLNQVAVVQKHLRLVPVRSTNMVVVNGGVYLSQGVPVCDGFAWVSQHFVPVIPSQTLGVWPGATHTDDLVVPHPVGGRAPNG